MKIFTVSLLTLTLVTGFVFYSSQLVCRDADILIEKIELGSSGADIMKLWLSLEDRLNLTVNHTVTDQIELYISELDYAENSEPIRAKLIIMLRDIKRSASFSIDRVM